MLKTNVARLVEFALEARARYPRAGGWQVGHDGRPFMLPRTGGITYTVKVGDTCYGWVADHVEPGVSVQVSGDSSARVEDNRALNCYLCVGNVATLVTGPARGATGVVVGKHGGVEHVMIDFPDRALERMDYNDRILLRAVGQGLELTDHPEVRLYNVSPALLAAWKLVGRNGALVVPVAAVVPAVLMGSGLGSTEPWKGDYDIQTSDRATLEQAGLDRLRLGDLVAIEGYDSAWGWSYKPDHLMVGVVVHADSFKSGHGPGVMTLLTAPRTALEVRRDPRANVGRLLKAGRYRDRKRKTA